MKILVAGSLAYDRIMTFPGKFADHILPDKIHILNVCFMVDGLDEKFGGTAGNIAYSLALLGEKPVILGCIGKDYREYEAWLTRNGLSLAGVTRIKTEFTAGAYITTDKSDNQITGFNPGAMKHSSGYDFADLDPADTIAIIAPGNLDDMVNYPAKCRELGIRYIFDPGQAIPALGGERLTSALTGSFITISNDYELEMIMKSTGLSKSDILGRVGHLITTLGEKGSVVCTTASETAIPAIPLSEVKDPTGAGDAYRSGLLKGLALGLSVEKAAEYAAVSAAYAVECVGTQEHAYTWAEFQARFAANFS